MSPLQALKKYFGYNSFRPKQAEIIDTVLGGRDCFVLMPTGGGKSVCYQIPAALLPGLTIVVSPLISLMKDQVESLLEAGIPACAINSSLPLEQSVQLQEACVNEKYKLVYLSPEALLASLHGWISRAKISLIAIDEAHCISQWGHDFRPEYTQLGQIRRGLPDVPMMALTATADKVTREDILKQLGLHNPYISVSSFDRPNLSLTVIRGFNGSEKLKAILRFLRERPGQAGIIYCMSRKTTESVAEKLTAKGIRALSYHAGLSADVRDKTQTAFINDDVQIIVATVAFGMGIDKSNVRWVIHYNLPKSIESYYQEIGRAGRDGDPADTLLFYNYADIIQLERFAQDSGQQNINMERLNRMREYAEASVCRRRILLNYFGEETSTDCHNCDVCKNPPTRFDGTTLAQKALSAIARTEESIGFSTVIDILRATYSPTVRSSHYEQLKTFGAGRDVTAHDWRDYLLQMLQLGLVEVAYNEGDHLKITTLGRDVLFGRRPIEFAQIQHEDFQKKEKEKKAARQKEKDTLSLFDAEEIQRGVTNGEMFERLKELRLRLAREQGFPPYVVFNDRTLHAMATLRPHTLDDFDRVPGVGDFKKAKYGEAFLEEINR